MGIRFSGLHAVTLLAAAYLWGCGGGGGDGGTGANPDVAPSAVITPANAAAVTESVLVAGALADQLGLELYALISELYVTFPVAVGAESPPDVRSLGKAIAIIANSMLGLDGVLRVRPTAVAEDRLPCDSGFVDFYVDIADTSLTAPTQGDRIELDFAACDGFEGIPGFIDGRLVLVIETLNSDALQLRADTTGFEISDGLLSASSSGRLTIRFFRNQPRVRIRTSSLRLEENGITYELNNFEWLEDFADSPVIEVSGNGNVASSLIDDEWVAFVIETPYRVSQAETYPMSGVFVIRGVEDSSVRLTILSSALVRLETDADGDGIYEASEDLAWSELLPMT